MTCISSQAIDGCVAGATIDHRALVLTLQIGAAQEGHQQAIPKVEVRKITSMREPPDQCPSRLVLDSTNWEENKTRWVLCN
eukprot:653917-Hanusia_phi.AAC.3